MTTIPNHNFDKSKAVQLTSALSIRQIFRIELDEYVVASPDLANIHYRFRSTEFSLFVRTIEIDIADLDIWEVKSLCCEDQTIVELRLFLASRKIMTFRDDGKLLITAGVEMPEGYHDQDWTVAAELFDLPMVEPCDRMMLSEGIIQNTSFFIEKASPGEVLKRIWIDHQNASSETVKGEFFDFAFQALPCGRVVFRTLQEMRELE